MNAITSPPQWENLRRLTIENEKYRDVHDYTPQSELVFMSIPPRGKVPREMHGHTTQFIRVEQGVATIYSDTFPRPRGIDIREGDYMFIEPGEWHEIVNESSTITLKLYTVYSPPEHVEDHDPRRNMGRKGRRGI